MSGVVSGAGCQRHSESRWPEERTALSSPSRGATQMLSFAGRHGGRGLSSLARPRASQTPLLAAIAPLAEAWSNMHSSGHGHGHGRGHSHGSWHQRGAPHEAAGAATLGALGLAGALAGVSALLAEEAGSAGGAGAVCEPADETDAGGGPNGEGPGSWDEAMSRCIPAIVSLKVNTTRCAAVRFASAIATDRRTMACHASYRSPRQILPPTPTSVPRRAFDTTSPGSSQATGFVVDAEKGLILTNRHVVCPGPVVAEAIFVNHEEVPLKVR